MFDMRDFLMEGLRKAVHEQPDSWTIDRAKAWYSEGWLKQEDLAEIHAAIAAKNPPEEIPMEQIEPPMM